MRPRLPLLALLVALAGCTGAGEPIEATAHDVEWNVSSRGSRELDMEMEKGGTISFVIDSSAEIAWDLHSHVQGESVLHQEGRGKLVNGTFTAPEDGAYSLFVRGTGATAVVRVHVEGPFRLRSG